MAKIKVFVSFDFDHDRVLRDFIVGQAKHRDSPFEISDYSLKEAAREPLWEANARRAIGRADVFVVMLGSKTRFAPGVKKEIAMARELGKARFQIIGYQHGTREWAATGAGRTYRWNWDNLKTLLAPRRGLFATWFLGE
jgi:hypothetical protein